MDIRNFFSALMGRNDDRNVLHTAHGDFNLARSADRQRLQRIVLDIQRTTDALTRKDIADWRAAWQLAINVDSPNRNRLYDIYRDADADGHLSGCISQRKGFVMAKSFKLTNADGEEVAEALHYFDQAWFKQLCRLVLDSVYYGHSLIELGNVGKDGDGCPCYDGVTLVPRKHVVPEFHRVVKNVGDDWHNGIDYHEEPYNSFLVEAGASDSLGLLLKAAQHTIPKKNMLAFWDAFGEVFGMPMRIAKTASRDPKDIQRLNDMMANMGSMLSMVTSYDTEIQLVENGKGDAFNVYDQRVSRANSELSKLIIGQTMTIEDGSSLSQSQTHLQVFQNLVEEDADMLRDVVNNQLLPRMVRHGFPLQGLHFDWDYSADYTPEQQVAYETMVADRYEVDPQYFADKYGMPVGERRNNMAAGGGDDDPNGTDPKKGKNDPKNGKGAADERPTDGNKGGNDPKKDDKQSNLARPFFD